MKNILTDQAIKNARPHSDRKQWRLSDGEGLHLLIKAQGKYWHCDYRFEGKRNTLAFGVYPKVSLKRAREMRGEAQEVLARGVDPSEHKKSQKKLKAQLEKNSFEIMAREYHQRYRDTWQPSYAEKMIRYFEKDVFPWMGNKPITAIEAPDIVSVIQRMDDRGSGSAARRVKQHIQQVYDYALAVGMVARNPATDIKVSKVLKPRIVKHYATLTDPIQVGELMRATDGFKGNFTTQCALKLAPLTMLRPGELLNGQWSEIDFEKATWTIPIKRMKVPTHIKEANLTVHLVPLSDQALTILKELYPLTGSGRGGLLFPSIRTVDRPLSNGTINAALRRMGFAQGEMTGHGFRHMASTLLNEMKGPDKKRRWDKDAIERQLAHGDENKIRDIYNNAEYMEQRREMLQVLADYLDELRAGGEIIPFRVKSG